MSNTMRWLLAVTVSMVVLAAGTAIGQGSAVGSRPSCVSASGQAIFGGFGYRHNVNITNGCTYAIDCHVFTDVNPQVQNVHLEPRASTTVPTFLSSPAREFVAHVDCPHVERDPVISDPSE